MHTLSLLVFAVISLGCAQETYAHRDGQELAEQVVWRDLYGMTDACPEIEWVRGDFIFGHDDGFTWAGWKIQVADHGAGPEAPIQISAFAHELMHYRTYLKTGDVDAGHWRGDWYMADKMAQLALAEAGL